MPPAGMINRCRSCNWGEGAQQPARAAGPGEPRSASATSVPDVRSSSRSPTMSPGAPASTGSFSPPHRLADVHPSRVRRHMRRTSVSARATLKATAPHQVPHAPTTRVSNPPSRPTGPRTSSSRRSPRSRRQSITTRRSPRCQPLVHRCAREGPMSAVAPGGQGVVRGRRPLAFREQIEPTVRILVATRLVRQIARAMRTSPDRGQVHEADIGGVHRGDVVAAGTLHPQSDGVVAPVRYI